MLFDRLPNSAQYPTLHIKVLVEKGFAKFIQSTGEVILSPDDMKDFSSAAYCNETHIPVYSIFPF